MISEHLGIGCVGVASGAKWAKPTALGAHVPPTNLVLRLFFDKSQKKTSKTTPKIAKSQAPRAACSPPRLPPPPPPPPPPRRARPPRPRPLAPTAPPPRAQPAPINDVPAGPQRIRAARIGYSPSDQLVTVAAGQVAIANLAIAAVSVTLDQVVVVGYGTQKRSDLTGSVASVTPQVEQTPITSLEQTLQGAAPGVIVSTASSAPGGGISIRIRGGSSVTGNNEPLYVIDGFPIENDPDKSSPTDGGRDATVTVPANPLATINPNDIASIEILKDASATSIYGARGANGVIIITTKRGAPGAPAIHARHLHRHAEHREALRHAERQGVRAVRECVGAGADHADTPFPNVDTISTGNRLAGSDLPRRADEQLPARAHGRLRRRQRHAICAVSGGVLQQTGIVAGSDFKRMSLRGNLSQGVGTKLQLASNLLVSRVASSQVPTDGSFNAGAGAVGAALQYLPIMPVRRADGNYTLVSTDCPVVLTSVGRFTGGNIPNPVAMRASTSATSSATRACSPTPSATTRSCRRPVSA